MKKITLLILLFGCVVMSLSASFYLDFGGGYGASSAAMREEQHERANDVAIEASLRVGYGPIMIGDMPSFIVGEVSGVDGFKRKYGSIPESSWNSSWSKGKLGSQFLGLGFLIYPEDYLQLGLSAGQAGDGFGINTTVATDLGEKHGALIGLKYTYMNDPADQYDKNGPYHYAGVFLKYRYIKGVWEKGDAEGKDYPRLAAFGGLVTSWYDDKLDTKTLFHGGLSYQMQPFDFLVVDPGLRYVSRGAKIDTPREWSNIYLNYLDIFTKLKLKSEETLIFPYVGAYYGLLLSAEKNQEDIKDEFENGDFGLMFGLEYIHNNKFTYGLEFNMGLTEIVKNTDNKNKAVLLNIGYLF